VTARRHVTVVDKKAAEDYRAACSCGWHGRRCKTFNAALSDAAGHERAAGREEG
jgi:hypothetical protein